MRTTFCPWCDSVLMKHKMHCWICIVTQKSIQRRAWEGVINVDRCRKDISLKDDDAVVNDATIAPTVGVNDMNLETSRTLNGRANVDRRDRMMVEPASVLTVGRLLGHRNRPPNGRWSLFYVVRRHVHWEAVVRRPSFFVRVQTSHLPPGRVRRDAPRRRRLIHHLHRPLHR